MTIRRFLTTLGILAFAVPVDAQGPVLAPKNPSDLVTLSPFNGSSCGPGGTTLERRLLPDATSAPFVIPEGHVLVLTGMSWIVSGASPNTAASASVNVTVDPTSSIQTVFITGAFTDATGASFGSAAIPHVVVKSGVALCLGVTGVTDRGIVNGFLARDK